MQPVQLEKQQDFERARRANALSNIENGDDVVSDDGGSEASSNLELEGTGDDEDEGHM